MADHARTEAIAQAVQTNPVNDSYEGIVNMPNCYMNSRVNKIKITEYCMIPPSYDVPDGIYAKAIYAWGLGDHAVADPQGNTLISKLKFTKAADTLHPTWEGTKLPQANLLHADVDGLTSTQLLEPVDEEPKNLYTDRYGSLGPKVRSILTGPFWNRVHKDYPYFSDRWYTVPGRTKRMNAFTGCFLYVGVATGIAAGATTAASTEIVPHFVGDTTIDETYLNFHYVFEFNEFNDSFDQSA